MHNSRTLFLLVLQICLLAAMLRGHAFDAHAFEIGSTPAIIIGQNLSGSLNATANTVDSPQGLAFDRAGGLWVVDGLNERVLEFMPPFRSNMNASLVLGQPNFYASYFSETAWQQIQSQYQVGPNIFNGVAAVEIDAKGDVWISDGGKSGLVEFVPPLSNGMNASIIIGEPNFKEEYWRHHPAANAARNRMSGVEGFAFDPFGNVWVADWDYNRVLEFTPPFKNGMDASLVIGQPNFTTGLCPTYQSEPGIVAYACPQSDPGPAHLRGPWAVAFDISGDLWVSDSAFNGGQLMGRILEFKPPFRDGMNASLVKDLPYVNSLAFDREGNLWVGTSTWLSQGQGRVFEFNPPFSAAMNASLVLGSDYPGNLAVFPPRSSTFLNPLIMRPAALAFDSADNLWISDQLSAIVCVSVSCNPGPGRILGLDSQVHSVLGHNGRVYFRNDRGLLAPLSFIPNDHVGSLAFPEGLFNFTIQGLNPTAPVTLTIIFPNPLPPTMGWWFNEGGRWMSLPASQVSINGANLTLTLTGASSNGIISMLGGPTLGIGIAQISNPTQLANTSTSTTSALTNAGEFPVESIAAGIIAGLAVLTILRYRRRRRL